MKLAMVAYAKLNLDLKVLGPAQGGHHEISSHFQAISLHDLLMVEAADQTSLQGGFPDDLILRSVSALEEAANRRLPARWQLFKRIPVGSGMAGGSSNAALALRALARLYRLEVNLHQVAKQIGADVPFFLQGGGQLTSGKGDVLRPATLAQGWFALAWPGFAISTGAVYQAWDQLGGDGENQLTRAALAIEPRLQTFVDQLGSDWQMTGSGSAWFRKCSDRAMAEAAIAHLSCWKTIAQPIGRWDQP
ncbi:MAG: 4-(cytidine 5'-diphospho)-2-C-methyl-D-erythritol kinase [Candidatus Dormibacteraceae bacterium]